MKIAVISSSAPFGKGESFVINEANAIAEDGHDVLLVPTQLRRGNPNRFRTHPLIKLLAQPSLSFRVLGGFCFYCLKSPGRLLRLLRLTCDKTSFWNSLKNFFVLPKAVWLSKQLEENNIEHIHAHWLTTSATLAMVSSHLTGIPWSCTAHRGDIVADNLLEAKSESAAFIRFISNSGVELARTRAGIANSKIHVLHLGIDLPGVVNKPENKASQSGDRPFTVLCPANLIPVKGHHYLIEAIDKMQFGQKIQLILAGDGRLREQLTAQVRKLGLERQVKFRGHVPHSELLSLYKSRQVDLVVLPSLDLGNGLHEGIPVSLMEAMAYGIPVISTNTGGIPELLKDTKRNLAFGVMVAGGNSGELATEMDKMVGSSSVRKKWSELGQNRIDDAFNQQKTTRVLLELIQDYRHT